MPESFRSGVVVLVAGSFLLGCAAVVLGFSAGFWRIAVIVGLVAVVRTMHVWTVRRREDRCGPEEFLREIGDRGEFTEAEILDARSQLAGILGVDQAFLDPRNPSASGSRNSIFWAALSWAWMILQRRSTNTNVTARSRQGDWQIVPSAPSS